MNGVTKYIMAIFMVYSCLCTAEQVDVEIETLAHRRVVEALRKMRIKEFDGFNLGERIQLPDSIGANFGSRQDDLKEVVCGDKVYSFTYDKKQNLIVRETLGPDLSPVSSDVFIKHLMLITPKTHLVHKVGMIFGCIPKKIESLYACVQDEISKIVQFPMSKASLVKLIEDGEVKVDNGRQRLEIKCDTSTVPSVIEPSDLTTIILFYVGVADLKSIEIEKAFEQNPKMMEAYEVQRWIDDFNSRPPFTSFCGVEFGTRLTGDLERTEDGRYLYGYVELSKPFRGCDTAKVYAGVESRKIFKVEVVTKEVSPCDYTLRQILNARYKPNGNPLIEFHSYCEKFSKYPSYELMERERLRIKNLCKNNDRLKQLGFSDWRPHYNLNGGHIEVTTRKVGTGDFYNTVEEIGARRDYVLAVTKEREKEVGVLIARSHKYERLANQEYVEESGGDGSGVL